MCTDSCAQVVTKRRFQPEREAWIAGAFLLGYSQLTGQDWWLRVNPEDSAPDIFAATFRESEHGPVKETLDIEIFEYEQHAKGDLAEAIARKLAGKAYPTHYRLVCYVHHRPGEPFTPGVVAEAVKATQPRVAEIWVVASIVGPSPTSYATVRLFPDALIHPFDHEGACSQAKQPDIAKVRRGSSRDDEMQFGWLQVDLPSTRTTACETE